MLSYTHPMLFRTSISALLLVAALSLPARLAFAGPLKDCLNSPTSQFEHDCFEQYGWEGSGGSVSTFSVLLARITAILDTIIPFIIGLAVFVILWGILGYVAHAGEEEKRAEARQFIIWGILGVFIMLSVWGFVAILDNSFNLSKSEPSRSAMPSLPAIPGVSPN